MTFITNIISIVATPVIIKVIPMVLMELGSFEVMPRSTIHLAASNDIKNMIMKNIAIVRVGSIGISGKLSKKMNRVYVPPNIPRIIIECSQM